MNFLKIVKIITGTIAVLGFFVVIGAVGACDYMDEIGQHYNFADYIPQMIIGLLMIFQMFVINKCLFRKKGESDD